MPRSGGLYTYLREVFGDAVAFFYGWTNFMIAGSGGIATVAFILASHAGEILGVQQSHGPGTPGSLRTVAWLSLSSGQHRREASRQRRGAVSHLGQPAWSAGGCDSAIGIDES